jgi:hypothetical protein
VTAPVEEVLVGDERVVGGQLEDVLMSLGSSQGAKPAPWVLQQYTTQNIFSYPAVLHNKPTKFMPFFKSPGFFS